MQDEIGPKPGRLAGFWFECAAKTFDAAPQPPEKRLH
jgi:hypothetical protein